jgi:hypothetical protein
MRAIAVSLAMCLLALAALAGPPARAADSCAAALTNDCLGQTLMQMGFEPKALNKGFLVTQKEGTWTFYVQFVLSDDGTKLGLNSNLGDVNEAEVTADQWRALLASNTDIDPSSFNYDPAKKRLYLHRVMDNRSLTPAILKTQLDNFINDMRSTSKLWGFTH